MNTVARKSALWLPLMLGALVLAVFSPSLEYEFAPLDDDVNVVYNPHHGPPGAAHSRWAFTDSTYIRRYQPLGWLALSSASLLSGLKPWGYHAVSVGQHAVNSLLLGWLLQALLRRSSTANIGFTQSLAP